MKIQLVIEGNGEKLEINCEHKYEMKNAMLIDNEAIDTIINLIVLTTTKFEENENKN